MEPTQTKDNTPATTASHEPIYSIAQAFQHWKNFFEYRPPTSATLKLLQLQIGQTVCKARRPIRN